jgi:hypothetical protein
MTLDASGNLGIGTSSPAYKLDVLGNVNRFAGASCDGIFLSSNPSTDTLYYGANYFNNNGTEGVNASGRASWRIATLLSGSPTFSIGYRAPSAGAGTFTQAMTLDASGNVGIGTSSPLGLLQLNTDNGNGQATNRGNLILVDQTGTGVGSTKGIELKGSTSGAGYGVKLYMNNDSDYFGIATRFSSATWTERLAISQNNGNVTLTNNLSVGGATPTTSGTGITFPATQSASSNANTLDDYEEGTWTPTVLSGGVGITVNTASYTKIGRMVYLQFDVTIASNSSASAFQIGSLPFAQGSSRFTGVAIGYNTSGTNMAAIIGAADIEFFLAGSGTAATNIQASGARFIGATCYQV